MERNVTTDLFCKKCSLQFDNKFILDMHLKLVHEKIRKSTVSNKEKTERKHGKRSIDFNEKSPIKCRTKTKVSRVQYRLYSQNIS